MSRLTLLHINIIGVVVALIVAAGLYFTLITGAQDEKQKAQTKYEGVLARYEKLPTAKANLAKAIKARDEAQRNYAVYERQYMPVLGYTSDRMTTMMRVFWPNNGKSWPERFRRNLISWMNKEQRRTGVVWENPNVLVLGPYGPNPNTIDAGRQGEGLGTNGNTLHYDFPITVRAKSMSAILNHIRNWPNITMAGVPVVNGLNIVGNSPNLQASYNLTLTIILHEKIPEPDPRVGGNASAPAGPGTGGGGGGGFGGSGGGSGGIGVPSASGITGGGRSMSGGGGMSGGAPGMTTNR